MTKTLTTETKTLLTAKEASKIAKDYYNDLTPDEKHRITVEEVELVDDGKYWLITLGIYTPTEAMSLISQGLKEALNYKVITVNRNTGEVISMKMRMHPLANYLPRPN